MCTCVPSVRHWHSRRTAGGSPISGSARTAARPSRYHRAGLRQLPALLPRRGVARPGLQPPKPKGLPGAPGRLSRRPSRPLSTNPGGANRSCGQLSSVHSKCFRGPSASGANRSRVAPNVSIGRGDASASGNGEGPTRRLEFEKPLQFLATSLRGLVLEPTTFQQGNSSRRIEGANMDPKGNNRDHECRSKTRSTSREGHQRAALPIAGCCHRAAGG